MVPSRGTFTRLEHPTFGHYIGAVPVHGCLEKGCVGHARQQGWVVRTLYFMIRAIRGVAFLV